MIFMYLCGFTFMHGVVVGIIVLPFFYFFKIDINYYGYVIAVIFISAIIRVVLLKKEVFEG